VRNALALALLCFVGAVLGAQSLFSGWETPAGSRPGRPGLQSPVLKESPIPSSRLHRRPGFEPARVQWLSTIDETGRVTPVSIVRSLDSRRGGLDDQSKTILEGWSFAPARLNGKPTRVGVLLSVPLGDDRPVERPAKLNRDLAVFTAGVRSINDPDVVPPIQLMSMAPGYPDDGRMRGRSGDVKLAIIIEPDGRVGRVMIAQSAWREIDEAAVIAVKEWRYLPAEVGGSPVASWIIVPIRFGLIREP
jgi:TonB family protein